MAKLLVALATIAATSYVSAAPNVATLNARKSMTYAGYNMASNLAGGGCKTQQHWGSDFDIISNWPINALGKAKAIRISSTSHCNALSRMAEPAMQHGYKIFASLSLDDDLFESDKSALRAFLINDPEHCDALSAVGVGSEVGSSEASVYIVVGKMREVKELLADVKCQVPLTHSAAFSAYLNTAAGFDKVVALSDVLAVDYIPYYDNKTDTIEASVELFREAIQAVQSLHKDKPLWITATGYSTSASPEDHYRTAASLSNLQKYWWSMTCGNGPLTQIPSFFWFSAFDDHSKHGETERNFGLATPDKKPKIVLACPKV
ncbi:glycoside hydrolase superfamily [Protomyces lactucae-debilis]|uniref:glucan endo-1,3-beta-D-glucosidase n=1 Tax=Protomyces lactucae-debilis TaxID=2754530 RepID=A0A1Y2FNG3_PROLT|nr:glycoside hydrolase superfamily [Protomyces lactucae-debilis]ORY85532.1 glycoside hydrolase superfamily [Protomyces lactucae-debilis]